MTEIKCLKAQIEMQEFDKQALRRNITELEDEKDRQQ